MTSTLNPHRIPPSAVAFQPGDVLLFSRQGFYNRLIQIKTWSRVSHCEVIAMGGPLLAHPMAVASRNGQGVGYYALDLTGLYCVLRPTVPFDAKAAWEWFLTVNGQGYDWLGLLAFTSAKLQGRENGKMFCSEFSTRYLRAGGVDPFNGYDADGIAPSEYLKSPLLQRIGIEAAHV
jgi:hypothetical protein